MTIHWVSAFIDVPEAEFDAAAAFWSAATSTTLSAPRGDRDQWVTLEPADGYAPLRMQRLGDEPRIHLDLHADDVAGLRDRAVALGATLVMEPGYAILRSPGGLTFCVVSGDGSERLGGPIDADAPHRLDQLSIDCPAEVFEAEVTFWSELTEWGTGRAMLPEFRSLEQPDHIPYRFLFQRLGDDDGRGDVHVHLDISSGENRAAVVERHVGFGAEVVQRFEHWTVMHDLAGLTYCVTGRRPFGVV